LPPEARELRFVRRCAGVGSLGRERFAVLAMHDGGLIGRELKAILPPALAWSSSSSVPSNAIALSQRAIRAQDPFFHGDERWTVRRLSPDCSKIEISDLPRRRDDAKLLRAMGWETANIHLATPTARIRADVKKRAPRWLERNAAAMIASVLDDHQSWRNHARP
jgi:hypothetical protein